MRGATAAMIVAAALAGCATTPDDLALETGGAPAAGLADTGVRQQLPPKPDDEDDDDGEAMLAVSGPAQLFGSRGSPAAAALTGQGGPAAAATAPLSAGSPLATPSATLGAGPATGRAPTPLLALNGTPAAIMTPAPQRGLAGPTLAVRTPLGGAQVTAPATSNTQLLNAVAARAGGAAAPLTPPRLPAAAVLNRVLPGLLNPPVGP